MAYSVTSRREPLVVAALKYLINDKAPQARGRMHREVISLGQLAGAVLAPALVQQISHQLERLCRDVEPSSLEKKVRWENQK